MKSSPRTDKLKVQLSNLIDNAFDFLYQAVQDFENKPKYSIIHFHASMELFLKARLMSDHWSLIVTREDKPNWSKFNNGDFRSVALSESIVLLEEVVGTKMPEKLRKGLEGLGKHRNKHVHFFHKDQSTESSDAWKASIAQEQLRIWYYMYEILKRDWIETFSGFISEIENVHDSLRKQREFLQVVFDEKQKEFEILKKRGVILQNCPSCGYLALMPEASLSQVQSFQCLVCNAISTSVEIRCPQCENPVTFSNEGFSECEVCKKQFSPDDLADSLAEDLDLKNRNDPYEQNPLGNCANCDGCSTIVPLREGRYFCTSCFEEFDEIFLCDWCNEMTTRETTASSIMGCSHCDGSSNYD